MNERIKRTAPLLQVRSRALDERRAELARATRVANEAREAQKMSHEAWERHALLAARTAHGTVWEHADARAHVDDLWRGALRAADLAALAEEKERAALAAVLHAERELKKIEVWREGLVDMERLAAARRERIAADEHTARMYVTRR